METFLKIRNLRKGYSMGRGNLQAVVDVEKFEMAAASQLAIEGPSGSGKTTFLNLIAGIIKADSGSIFLGNQEITSLRESDRDLIRAITVGYVFQSFYLLQGCTALENIMVAMAIGGNANKDRARELLAWVGISGKENYFPSQLSIGQQQRVGVARALANNPKLMLADEPTGNLDAKNAAGSIDLLRSLCEQNGCTLLVVSHDQNIIGRFQQSIKWEELNSVQVKDDEF